MANVNLKRNDSFAQKKSVSVLACTLKAAENDFVATSQNYLLATLPHDAIILDAYIHVVEASDAVTSATMTLGTTEGGTQILSAANVKTTGKKGTFTGQSLTGTGVDVYLGMTAAGAATADVGEYVVVVEYMEFTKNTGEYTRI